MKIGIGITTKNRPEVAEYCIDQYLRHSKEAHRIVLLDDASDLDKTISSIPSGVDYISDGVWRGVAGSRNRLLRELADCDFVVISDDDVFPIATGWLLKFIEVYRVNQEQNVINAAPSIHYDWIEPVGTWVENDDATGRYGLVTTSSAQGGFWFFTRHALNVLGGFRELSKYGHEDGEMFTRMHRAGVAPLGTPPWNTVTISNLSDLIHCCDTQGGHGSLIWKHRSAIHEDKHQYIKEAERAMKDIQNLPVYFDIFKNNR